MTVVVLVSSEMGSVTAFYHARTEHKVVASSAWIVVRTEPV